MTDQQNNKVLHELFGKCWHDFRCSATCRCGIFCRSDFAGNPDYAADPRLVLEAMKEKNRLGEFLIFLCRQRITVPEMSYRIDVDLILDRTGRLGDLAIEFFKEQERK